MQTVLEKPQVDDQTQLAATTIEAVTDLLKAAATPSPTLAAPQSALTKLGTAWCGPTPMNSTMWPLDMWEVGAYGPIKMTPPYGDTPSENLLEAAIGWCQKRGLVGVAGTGEADVEAVFPDAGHIRTTEVAAFLDFAAERIIRFGWIQGTERYEEFVCSVGALRLRHAQLVPIMGENRAERLAEQASGALTSFLHRHRGNMQGIIGWNDTTGRTKAQVVTAFREAAAELRGINAPRIRRAVLA